MMRVMLFIFMLIFVSCQGLMHESRLDSLSSYTLSDVTPLHCSDKTASFYNTKILFIVDKTSANKKLASKDLQIQNIKKIVQNSQAGVQYGVVAFSKDTVLLPLSNYQVPIFTSDKKQVGEALSVLEKTKNSGKINYSKILQSIKKALTFDAVQNENKVVDYHLVFVSGDSLEDSKDDRVVFAQQLQELKKNNNLYVHSIYYGENEIEETKNVSTLLKKGANWMLSAYTVVQVGVPAGGVFNTDKEDEEEEGEEQEDNQHVKFLKAISSTGSYGENLSKDQFNMKDSWELKHFMVYNMNASECRDGVVRVDSDQDGICDEDEIALEGFNPQDKFSFNDGYSDAFHYLALSKNKMLPNCKNRLDIDHDLLTHCEEQYLNSISNSPSKKLRIDNPDSDGDGLIDGIETLIFLRTHLMAARDPKNLLSYNREDMNIKERLALSRSYNEQLTYKTELMPLRGENSSCYVLKQDKMPVYSDNSHRAPSENNVLVYFMRHQENSNKTIYQFKYEKVRSKGLFTDKPFYSSMQDNKLQHYSFSNY